MPLPDHLETLVQAEMDRIEREGVLVPSLAPPGGEAGANGDAGAPVLERLMGAVPVGRVQRFWPTAPPEGQPGGSPCTSDLSTASTVPGGFSTWVLAASEGVALTS